VHTVAQARSKAKDSSKRPVNRIPRPIALFLIAVVALVATMVAAGVVENANIGERSWQLPAVGQTVNGFAGAPVGSQEYLQAGYEHITPTVQG
jgi:hypothetical protein